MFPRWSLFFCALTRERIVKIDKGAYVAVSYSLSLENGEKIEQTAKGDPLGFVFGIGRMMPGLEKGLLGMEVGNQATVTVEPEDAYGVPRDELIREFPRKMFPEEVQIHEGDRLQAMSEHGPMAFEVKRVTDEKVLCDFNHPLAGERLVFDLQVQEVRPSTQEDIEAMDRCGSSSCSCDDDDDCSSCH
jgi:FKBP-type peptidyl-prolyl cis-trans isomerase 2